MRNCRTCRGRRCRCHHKGSSDNFVTEVISKIVNVPDEGEPGVKGDKLVRLYAKNMSTVNPPQLTPTLNPQGWSTQAPSLNQDEVRWYTEGYVNYDNTILTEMWSVPVPEKLDVNIENPPESSETGFRQV